MKKLFQNVSSTIFAIIFFFTLKSVVILIYWLAKSMISFTCFFLSLVFSSSANIKYRDDFNATFCFLFSSLASVSLLDGRRINTFTYSINVSSSYLINIYFRLLEKCAHRLLLKQLYKIFIVHHKSIICRMINYGTLDYRT